MSFERDRALLQERFRGDPWKIGVSCILLNQTTRTQVDRAVDLLFEEYPTPEILSRARLKNLAELFAQQGLQWIKAYRVIRFSDDYLSWDGSRATAPLLFGVGQYALDSLDLFHYGLDTDVPSGDKELLAYASGPKP